MHGLHDNNIISLPLQSTVEPSPTNPGSRNLVADALPPHIAIYDVHHGIYYDELAREQQHDHETTDYEMAITSPQWEKIPINNNSVLCDIVTGRPRPLILMKLHRTVFDVVHWTGSTIYHIYNQTDQEQICLAFHGEGYTTVGQELPM